MEKREYQNADAEVKVRVNVSAWTFRRDIKSVRCIKAAVGGDSIVNQINKESTTYRFPVSRRGCLLRSGASFCRVSLLPIAVL